MAFVKAGPSFPAMTVAEKPSLLSSFNRFRRFSVQFVTMRRFLQPGSSSASALGSHPAGWSARLNHQAGPKLGVLFHLQSEWLRIGDDTHGALQAEAAEADHGC